MADQLFEDFWKWRQLDSPELATMVGNHEYDDKLESYSLRSFHRRKETCEHFLALAQKLKHLTEDQSTENNLEIFIDGLQGFIKGLDTDGHLYPISFLEGIHVDFERTISYMIFKTVEDYQKLLSRFHQLPRQVEEIIELMREGIKKKKTLHSASMRGVVEEIAKLQTAPEESAFYSVFTTIPDSIPETDRIRLQNAAKEALSQKVLPAFKKLGSFVENEYNNALRPNISASSLPNGAEYYKQCLRFHLESDISADEVHNMGLQEVERINGEIKKLIAGLDLQLGTKDFAEKLRKDPSFRFSKKEDILNRYKDLVYKRINPELPKLFNKIPKAKLEIILQPESRSSGPVAFYIQGTFDGSRPGLFYVNPDVKKGMEFTMPALALHEGNPGHHLQNSYLMEQEKVPSFRAYLEDRRYSDIPVHFPMHTAYLEGWGLYSEFLGYELGTYTTPYEKYGHLSQEIFRACRLVVDTGMHTKGWSREDAINYFLNNTASSREDIESEIDRYITWPGQASAYKVGELKLKSLRSKATKALGNKFSIGEFHDVVLQNCGSLTYLEKQVDKYVSAKLK